MSEEDKPKRKPMPTDKNVANNRPYTPEKKGSMKRGPLDWTLDELIVYKNNGTMPKRIPDPKLLHKLGSIGVSIGNAASIFEITQDKIMDDPALYDAWKLGRAECGSRIRAKIVEQALDENVLNAMIYLDKILGGDNVAAEVNVNVTNTELQKIDTDSLLEVMFKQNDNKDPT